MIVVLCLLMKGPEKEKYFSTISFAIILLVLTPLLTIVSIEMASARETPVHIGNPHDFRPGPPIPSCNANFHQGPPDDPIKGCK